MTQDVVSVLVPFMDLISTNKATFFLDKLLEELSVAPTQQNVAFLKRVIEYNHIAYTSHFDLSGEWYTRSALCLSLYFAFTPTELEVEKKIIIQGSRFDPYISNLANAMVPRIKYQNKLMEPHLISLPLSQIRKYYYLYSNDELMEHLGSIGVNEKKHQFPSELDDNTYFYVPCFDMQKCFDPDLLGKDTKFLFRVEAFEHKIIRFVEMINEKLSRTYIEDWEEEFKKFFFYVASTCHVDSTTIADIITNALFMGRHSVLCKNFLISPQEYLQQNDLLKDVRTGVKDARWIRDLPFVAYNFWFHHVLNFRYLIFRINADENFFASIYSPLTEGMICFFILEFVENNYILVSQDISESKNECIKAFINAFFSLEGYKQHCKKIASIMGRKYKKYAKRYNPFTKGEEVFLAIGMLKVFKRVVFAISHLQRLGIEPKDVPTDLSVIIHQMVQDMESATRNIMKLMKKTVLPDRNNLILAIGDLIEKFEVIVDNIEQFVFSRYGRY